MNAYFWGVMILVGMTVVGAYLVHRAMVVKGPRRELPSDPGERLGRALEDMRLRGIATPEELAAATEVSQELAPEAKPASEPAPLAGRRTKPSSRRRSRRGRALR